MGRTQQSQGLAPPSIRKDVRAKQARHVVNKVIPSLLASSARARRGADGSAVFADPGPNLGHSSHGEKDGKDEIEGDGYVKRKGQGRRKVKGGDGDSSAKERKGGAGGGKGRKRGGSVDEATGELSLDGILVKRKGERVVRVVATDTLTAAQMLSTQASGEKKKQPNPMVLNMASPLRPGGGVLVGATSQEEFLCARTTLLPSLKEEFYRLPEIGGIYTHDVLVFRDSSSLGKASGDLGPAGRYWIDVVSAGMLRFPDLEGDGEEEERRLGKKDRELVEAKMRAVLRIACAKGVKRIVLGAWGCGAYGNPVRDIARAWRSIIDGSSRSDGTKKGKGSLQESWDSIEEVVFAIANRKMATEFSKHYDRHIEVEAGPGGSRYQEDEDDEEEEEDPVAEELRTKINEMEGQLVQVWNADLKARLEVILDGLKTQLKEREADIQIDDEEGGGIDVNQTGEENGGDSSDSNDSFTVLNSAPDEDGEDTDDDIFEDLGKRNSLQ